MTLIYFLYLLTSLCKIGQPGGSNFRQMCRLFISTVNSLFQLSVSSTPALNQTHKRPLAKLHLSKRTTTSDEMLPGDPNAEVCAVKQGWDPREHGTANTRLIR